MELTKARYETDYGFIDYGYNYDVLVFMGSYIHPQYRKQGKFKEMMLALIFSFRKGIKVQVPVNTKFLVHTFKELGFYEVESIEYWGKLNTATLLETIL